MNDATVPTTPRRDYLRTFHGDTVNDPYEWLRNKEDPEVIAWLESQNEYADTRMAHLEPLREDLFNEFNERIEQTDMSVPERRSDWWYFSRIEQGQQYGVSARAPLAQHADRPDITPGQKLAGEQVIVDGNVEAEGEEFFSLGALSISPCQEFVAFSVDTSGDERYDVRVRNIRTGEVIDDVVRGVGARLVWSACGNYFWYIRVDDAWRPHQVWRHAVGTAAEDDVLVFEESDERFWMGIGISDDDEFLQISVGSKMTSEEHLISRNDPTAQPRCVAPREHGVEYDVSCAGDRLVITHNVGREDFEIATAPLDAKSRDQWSPWYCPTEAERILGVVVFASHAVVISRRGGLSSISLAARNGREESGFDAPEPVVFAEELYTTYLGNNPEYRTDSVLISYQSMVTPKQVIELDLRSGEQTVLKTQQVHGDVDLANYRQLRSWATAADGMKIPVSIMHHKNTPLDGTAPCVLYGYGSYEHSIDPTFSATRLSLADRGVVFAIAHVRGGGEMGRAWYNGGKLGNKRATFTDFITCADHLDISGKVDGRRIAAMGGSAGGLLIGAAINLSPERFCAVHAAVPFVDSLTTILNPELPLTVPEWEEWGDPLHDPEAYAYIKSYAPYENLIAQNYPAILATTSLNDTRVFFTEPAKWVAKLQHVATNGDDKPILMKTEMVAGHGGKSGRYDSWRELAWEMSFLLDQLGATKRI